MGDTETLSGVKESLLLLASTMFVETVPAERDQAEIRLRIAEEDPLVRRPRRVPPVTSSAVLDS